MSEEFRISYNEFKRIFVNDKTNKISRLPDLAGVFLPINTNAKETALPEKHSLNPVEVKEYKTLLIAGAFLCYIQGSCSKISPDNVFTRLFEKNVVSGFPDEKKDFYIKMLKDIYLTDYNLKNNLFKAKCIKFLENNLFETQVVHEAQFLFANFGFDDRLVDLVKWEDDDLNILERFVCDGISLNNTVNRGKYKKIINFLDKPFFDDFSYVMETPERIEAYLGELLNLYLFLTVSYTIIQYSKLDEGDRTCNFDDLQHNSRLYFAFGKEDRPDPCDEAMSNVNGYKKVDSISYQLLAYMILFKMLNLNEEKKVYDIIEIKENIEQGTFEESQVCQEISNFNKQFCNYLKDAYPDYNGKELSEKNKNLSGSGLHTELKKLLNSIVYFIETERKSIPKRVRNNLLKICRPYIRSCSTYGSYFYIGKEQLIMLTKFIIPKDKDSLRVNLVFEGFENRGIFFSSKQKEKIIEYYNKLNLIEKKSDSGDAQYVRRII